MSEVQNQIVGIVGRKGTGKSSYLRELLRHCPRLLVFDVMAEHARKGGNQLQSSAKLAQFLKWSREQEKFAGFYVPDGALDEEIEEAIQLQEECRRRGESERRLHSMHYFLPVAPLRLIVMRRDRLSKAFSLALVNSRRLVCRTLCDSIFAKPVPGPQLSR